MNKLIPYLKKAEAQPGYKLFVEFEDGVGGIIDIIKWKGRGVFEYWNKEENFKAFKITHDKKLEWNEVIDMDPDAFYLQLTGKTYPNPRRGVETFGKVIRVFKVELYN